MSGPAEAEVAALLALPDGAREALKGCDGPGWWVAPAVLREPCLPHSYAGIKFSEADWLPCNPLEIVRVAGERAGVSEYAIDVDSTGATAHLGPVFDGAGDVACCEKPTSHLAALALLAEIWR